MRTGFTGKKMKINRSLLGKHPTSHKKQKQKTQKHLKNSNHINPPSPLSILKIGHNYSASIRVAAP
jgi:hypothetical protein